MRAATIWASTFIALAGPNVGAQNAQLALPACLLVHYDSVKGVPLAIAVNLIPRSLRLDSAGARGRPLAAQLDTVYPWKGPVVWGAFRLQRDSIAIWIGGEEEVIIRGVVSVDSIRGTLEINSDTGLRLQAQLTAVVQRCASS